MAPEPSTLVDTLSASESVDRESVRASVLQISGSLDIPAERFCLMTSKGIAAVIKGPVMDAHLSPLAHSWRCIWVVQWVAPSRCTAYTTNS